VPSKEGNVDAEIQLEEEDGVVSVLGVISGRQVEARIPIVEGEPTLIVR